MSFLSKRTTLAAPATLPTATGPKAGARTPALPEPLEGRRLMSVAVVINGTEAADTIRIRQSGATVSITRNGSTTARSNVSSLTVFGRGGNDVITADSTVKVPLVLHGGAGHDSLVGGSGADRLYGDAGSDTLSGGAGDDVLVTLGGGSENDRLTGGSGHDNFWIDADGRDRMSDLARSDVYHKVGSFVTSRFQWSGGKVTTAKIPLSLQGQNLADPIASGSARGWKDFSDHPLFPSGGPSELDVDQNGAADCYFLAPTSSIAKIDPQRISDHVVDLGDGTYGVHFIRDGAHYFLRVDGDLPVDGAGNPFYAGLGREGSIWVAILEKAWAFFRKNQGSYDSINWGKVSEPYEALDVPSVSRAYSASSISWNGGILGTIDSLLKDRYSVVYSTRDRQPAGSKVRPDHVVLVDRIVRDSHGVATGVVLRDQYKTDLPTVNDGRSDGYVTLTAAQAAAWMEGIMWCRV